MSDFSAAHRTKPLMHTVAFHGVPMFRGLALAIDHIEQHGATVAIFSADRRHSVLDPFNREHGTQLRSQEQLIEDAKHGGSGANPVNMTSHCLHADLAVQGVLAAHDIHVEVTGEIPWHALGIDLSDRGKVEDCSHFLKVAHELGYAFTQPYPTSKSEKHHVICAKSPVHVLETSNVIPKRDA
jgi:hypothetical protein